MARGDKALTRYTLIADLLDQAFRVPGTSWRFGLDALIGLIPGAGDLLGSLAGLYGILVARHLGAPASIQMRMLLYLGVDAIVGAVPLLGDLFDFAFKAHVRNRVLLERWLLQPHRTQRSSALSLLAIVLGLLVILAGAIWITVWMLHWVFATCCTRPGP
jgi:hypothetical protein